MKPFSFMPLYGFPFKITGFLIALVSAILTLSMNKDFEILIYAGLLIIVFSKERNENTQIEKLRNELFKLSFGLFLSVLIALYITEWLITEFIFKPDSLIIVGLPLIFYLMVFYLSLIFKLTPDSSTELNDQIKRNKALYILWISIIVIIFALLILV